MLRWLFCIFVCGCSSAHFKDDAKIDGGDWGNGSSGSPGMAPRNPDHVTGDSGAFGDPGSRESDASPPPAPALDAGNACGPVSPGDFKVVEIMIASQYGSGDKGEWIEIQNAKSCTLNAKGLQIWTPRGLGKNTVTIGADAFIAPNGTFVVADSANAQINHALPGNIFAFEGEPADALKNDGDTITIDFGQTTIDKISYPKFYNLAYATSVSFPADCAWSDRSDWGRWSDSFAKYGEGLFKGTPNADNTDVSCY